MEYAHRNAAFIILNGHHCNKNIKVSASNMKINHYRGILET